MPMTTFRQRGALVRPSEKHSGKWFVLVGHKVIGAVWSGAQPSQYTAENSYEVKLGTHATLERAVDVLLDDH